MITTDDLRPFKTLEHKPMQLDEPAVIEAMPTPVEKSEQIDEVPKPTPMTERERLVALAKSQGWTPLPV